MKKRWIRIASMVACLVLLPRVSWAMHIAEGYLPVGWALFWWVVALLGVVPGVRKLARLLEERPREKMQIAMVGAFIFVLSALKLPSLTGSSSHATGIGLGAILFGPWVMIPMGVIVLLFQALLLAHGGLTTLGANAVSMAIVGPVVAYWIYTGFKKLKVPLWMSVILAASLGDLATYLVTAVQLALAHPVVDGGFGGSLVKFLGVFGVTQIPLALVEGILTFLILRMMIQHSSEMTWAQEK